MATGEIVSIQSKLGFAGTSGTYTNVTTSGTVTATLGASAKAYHATQSIGTASAEAIGVGDVTTTATYWVRLENKDATNFVTVYLRTASAPTDNAIGIIKPGEFFGPIRMQYTGGPTGSGSYSAGYPLLYAKADTAACSVEVMVTDG